MRVVWALGVGARGQKHVDCGHRDAMMVLLTVESFGSIPIVGRVHGSLSWRPQYKAGRVELGWQPSY